MRAGAGTDSEQAAPARTAPQPLPAHDRRRRRRWAVLAVLAACVPFGSLPSATARAEDHAPVALAVFAFELEDVSAAAAMTAADAAKDAETMQAVTREARRLLAASGRYRLVDGEATEAEPAERAVWRCDGCDVRIARRLGAAQSLAGVVRRVAQTEYYVAFRLADAATGRVIDQQAAFFIGSDDAWTSGVRSLLRRSLLASRQGD